MLSIYLLGVEVDVVMNLILRLEFGKIDFKAISDVLVRFFGNGGVASIMLFLSFSV
jgi:hypothetical protein